MELLPVLGMMLIPIGVVAIKILPEDYPRVGWIAALLFVIASWVGLLYFVSKSPRDRRWPKKLTLPAAATPSSDIQARSDKD